MCYKSFSGLTKDVVCHCVLHYAAEIGEVQVDFLREINVRDFAVDGYCFSNLIVGHAME
jgi:hypothetical protein